MGDSASKQTANLQLKPPQPERHQRNERNGTGGNLPLKAQQNSTDEKKSKSDNRPPQNSSDEKESKYDNGVSNLPPQSSSDEKEIKYDNYGWLGLGYVIGDIFRTLQYSCSIERTGLREVSTNRFFSS